MHDVCPSPCALVPAGRSTAPPQPASTAASVESLSLAADDYLDLPPDEQQAVLRQCLRLQEQYRRARTTLLQELSQQSAELERLQTSSAVLVTSVQVRAPCGRALLPGDMACAAHALAAALPAPEAVGPECPEYALMAAASSIAMPLGHSESNC